MGSSWSSLEPPNQPEELNLKIDVSPKPADPGIVSQHLKTMSDKVEVNLNGVKQSKSVWLVKVCSAAFHYSNEHMALSHVVWFFSAITTCTLCFWLLKLWNVLRVGWINYCILFYVDLKPQQAFICGSWSYTLINAFVCLF